MGFKPRRPRKLDFGVGDLVVMKRVTGVWRSTMKGTPKWVNWPQDPVFCIVEKIVETPPHTGDRKHRVLVSCKGLTGECGSPYSEWVDPKLLRKVLSVEEVNELVLRLPDEPLSY